jgi:tetratricopeptide (TPR) repeat protein
VQAYRLLAIAHIAEKSYPNARLALERGLKVAPNHLGLQLTLARVHRLMQQPYRELSALTAAVKSHPDMAIPHMSLAQAYVVRAQFDKAIAGYETALRIDPENAIAGNNLASLLLDHGGDVDRAYKMAKALRERLPGNPRIADTYGWACFKRKEYDEAVAALSFASRRLPRNPAVLYHLGAAFFAKGDHAQAKVELEASLADGRRFRGAEQARTLLSQLEKRRKR